MKPNRIENNNQELKEPKDEYGIKESLSDEIDVDGVSGWIEKPQTIEEYNREIEEAEKRIEAGEFYTHEDAMAIVNENIKNCLG